MSNSRAQDGWKRSRRCGSGACIDVNLEKRPVAVRRSQDPDGPRLSFGQAEWTNFVESVKADEFGTQRH